MRPPATSEMTFTALFPFCGLGAGAMGFLDARMPAFGKVARFVSVGGIDNDPEACKDFVMLTKSPALCVDVKALTVERLVEFCPNAPDTVFLSAPCKGSSKLISDAKAAEPKYAEMNRLAEIWIELMVRAWPTQPRLVLFENVPNLTTRAKAMLGRVKKLLKRAGYLLHDGFHECGELGGLAQRRRRWLMVARHATRVPPLLYQPPKQRVRACGEVLGPLPMPNHPDGGPMHVMPRISWLNWVRLALIPAGGDWRDLPGVVPEGSERRTIFKRHEVIDWQSTCGTVGGPGSNGVANVADPRLSPSKAPFDKAYGVLKWTEPARTIAGGSSVGQGAYAIADVRAKAAECDPGRIGLSVHEAAKVTGLGAFAIVDTRAPECPVMVIRDVKKAPTSIPVIVADDGTWHRPLTTLELAVLQGIPWLIDGKPLKLAGANVSAWRERIGNAVPPPAARAIAERMLVNLSAAATQSFTLSSEGAVWVKPIPRAFRRRDITVWIEDGRDVQ